MTRTKRYKAFADNAPVNHEDADVRSRRLKIVHQTYVASKPKEARQDVPISTRSTQRPAVRSTPRTMRCGLCDREYPVDHLVGSALKRTIQRIKSPNKTPRKTEHLEFGEDQEYDGYSSERKPPSPSRSATRGLYDHEVKLCVNCDIFVRITSS